MFGSVRVDLANYPIVSGMTPTAGGVVFFGDMGGNFYALDSSNGERSVITYAANGAQKVAVGCRRCDGRVADENRESQGRGARP